MEENKLDIKNDEIKETPKETYLNRDNMEVLSDALDISYYKNLQQDEIVDNLLLGEFDKSGNYVISKDILLELVTARKIIKESKDGRYILAAPIKEGFSDLLFTLQVDSEGSQSIASLRLIETNIKTNGTKEFLKTSIGRYKDDYDIYFMIKIKKIFNIVDSEDDGKDLNNEEFLTIILKKFQVFKTLKKHDGQFEDNAKKYIEKVLAILKDNPGKLSEYILRKYGVVFEEMKEFEGKPQYYKKLKIKLDNLINESLKQIKEPAVVSLINEARKQFLESCQKTKKEIFEVKVEVKQPIKEKPQAKKPAGGDKKVEKKKAGAKKAEVKKPAKKKEVKKGNNPQFKPLEASSPKIEPIKISLSEKSKSKENLNDIANRSLLEKNIANNLKKFIAQETKEELMSNKNNVFGKPSIQRVNQASEERTL